MARLGVTYQDIANAADQILGQGRQPTIEIIRNILGTGSSTTIANHLRKWRAEQDGSTSVAMKENLPTEFVSMMKGLWQRLQAHADNQIDSYKQETDQRIHHLQLEIEKYKTNNQRWQKMHDAWVKEKDALTREKLSLEQGIAHLQAENAALAATSKAHDQQLNEKQQRIDELHRLHKLGQENLEHYRESARVQRIMDQEKFAKQLQQVEISLKHAEQQIIIANQEKVALHKQLDKTINENNLLQNEKDEIANQYDKLQITSASLEKEYSEIKYHLLHSEQQYSTLQKKYEEHLIDLTDQKKQNAVLTSQFEAAIEEIKELKEQNKHLARAKWEVEQEKAQIEGANRQMEKMIRLKEVS